MIFGKICRGDLNLKYIFFVPLSIKLSLNELNYFFLFCLYANLLFSKSIEFGLFFGYLFSLFVDILYSCIRILIPNIQYRDTNISPQIVKCLLLKENSLLLIMLIFYIIKVVFRTIKWFVCKVCITILSLIHFV